MGRSIGRAMATTCQPTSPRLCTRLNSAEPRRSAVTSTPARPVSSRAIATTPVATGIVQPANRTPPKPGSPSSTRCSCRFPTSWSRTLPSELRAIARAHPETLYPLLFRTSAAALQQLAQDPRFLGGQIGMLGVLQTWTRDLRYHPHVHYLVPALALTPDGKRWLVGKRDFLVHVKPLGELFRAKFRVGLRQTPWAGQVNARAWAKSWVVDCRPVGNGASALKYLAPYIFRIALSNNRIEQVANDAVTFRYTEGKTGAQKRARLPLDTFIGRFLAHVLPKGFVKVRYYGLLSAGKRRLLAEVRSIRALGQTAPPQPRTVAALEPLVATPDRAVGRCPSCGQPMQLVQTLPPKRQQERLAVMVGEPSSRGPPDPDGVCVHR
jgi:hypothetical protein